MSSRIPPRLADLERPGVPRLELLLVLGALALGVLFAAYGIVTLRTESILPLVVLLLVAGAFNLGLIWLDRRRIAPRLVAWAARLGDLAFLTAGVFLTGGYDSPFFALYAFYIVVASLRYGWLGARRSFVLCLANWLLLLAFEIWIDYLPFLDLQALLELVGRLVAWTGMFGLIAVAVGALAQRHLDTEQALRQRDREREFLQEAGRQLSISLNPQQVLSVTLAQVSELMEVEAASLALVDRATGRFSFELAIGGADQTVQGLRFEPGQGIVGQVIVSGQPILVSDAASDPRHNVGVDRLSGYQTRSLLCVPLCVEGQIIGALEAVNKRGKSFGDEDLRLLSALADLAAPAIENARLHEQVRLHVERLQEAYDEVQRMDELKSTFIRNLSHELRTPLALIQGYLELILDEQLGALRSEQRQGLMVVSERAAALSHMVNDFITLETIGTLGFDLEVLNLSTLAQAALDHARDQAAKAGIELMSDLLPAEATPPIRGDLRRLGRVFEHLLDNGIKFSPNGGVVRLSMCCEGTMIRVQVQDQGIGLATDQLDRVFERFYQVDGSATRRYGGTGLGLSLVKDVVEAHGGAVWAESEGVPGKGSTFTFFLPIYSSDAVS